MLLLLLLLLLLEEDNDGCVVFLYCTCSFLSFCSLQIKLKISIPFHVVWEEDDTLHEGELEYKSDDFDLYWGSSATNSHTSSSLLLAVAFGLLIVVLF